MYFIYNILKITLFYLNSFNKFFLFKFFKVKEILSTKIEGDKWKYNSFYFYFYKNVENNK